MTISDEMRKLIKKNFKEGLSKEKIATLFNISLRSVYRILGEKCTKTKVSLRKRKITKTLECIKRGFNAVKRSGKLINSSRIKTKLPIDISRRTIRRYISYYTKIKFRRVPRQTILTNLQKIKRVEIVRDWICSKIDPDAIIFSDEVPFTLDGSDNAYSYIDKDGMVRNMRLHKGGTIMLWGAITYEGHFVFKVIEGYINSKKYCKVMEEKLVPLVNNINRSYIYQQDNARCHVSRFSQEYFRNKTIPLLRWPPNSADLNPIEHLWGIIKQNVYDGTLFNSKDQLWTKIMQVISLITPETIRSLYKSFLRRMCDILCNGGSKIV